MKQTAVEWLENKIDNELKVIDNLYGKEIMGRKIALSFVKRILTEAKEMEKQQIMNAWYNGFEENRPYVDHSEDYYNETFKQD